MNRNSISRYESGAREAGYKTLVRIADYLECSVDFLPRRTDDPRMYPKAAGKTLPEKQ